MFFYEDCLEEEYLVTSGRTAFAINLLWKYTTQMIVNKCAFEGLAASYNLFHYGRLNQDESRKEVEEMSQRYQVTGPVSHDIEATIRFRLPRLHQEFSSRCTHYILKVLSVEFISDGPNITVIKQDVKK